MQSNFLYVNMSIVCKLIVCHHGLSFKPLLYIYIYDKGIMKSSIFLRLVPVDICHYIILELSINAL